MLVPKVFLSRFGWIFSMFFCCCCCSQRQTVCESIVSRSWSTMTWHEGVLSRRNREQTLYRYRIEPQRLLPQLGKKVRFAIGSRSNCDKKWNKDEKYRVPYLRFDSYNFTTAIPSLYHVLVTSINYYFSDKVWVVNNVSHGGWRPKYLSNNRHIILAVFHNYAHEIFVMRRVLDTPQTGSFLTVEPGSLSPGLG